MNGAEVMRGAPWVCMGVHGCGAPGPMGVHGCGAPGPMVVHGCGAPGPQPFMFSLSSRMKKISQPHCPTIFLSNEAYCYTYCYTY